MNNEKFNPIAKLPTLPGAKIASDELETNVIDSTYPPVKNTEQKIEKPQIEIRIKPAVTEEKVDETTEEKRITLVRVTILISLIVLVFAGILLTLQLVPKIMGGVSHLSQPFSSLFVSKNQTTSTSTKPTNVPAYIPLVSNTTEVTPIVVNVVASTTTTTRQPTIISQPKAPAKLLVTIISTVFNGYQTVVKFNVQNVGGTTSNPWSFSATLPSSITPTYYSVQQAPITAKGGVIFTLGFTADQYQNTPAQIILYTQNGNTTSYLSY